MQTPIGAAVLSTLCLSKKGTTVLSRTNYQKIFYNSDVLAASQLNSKRHEIHCIFDYLLRQNEGILHPRSPMRSTKKKKNKKNKKIKIKPHFTDVLGIYIFWDDLLIY